MSKISALRFQSGLDGLGPAADPAKRWSDALTLLLVAAGLLLRSRGMLFGFEGLWGDECGWATRLMDRPLLTGFIRPLGFMALTKALVTLFGFKAIVLRALPFAAGIATVLLAPRFARELLKNRGARLLLVGVIALHPAAIDLAKEFKPYALGLLLHIALVTLALVYARTRSSASLALLLAVALSGVLFAQDAIFAYPGVFLIAGWAALRPRRPRHLAAIAGCALALLAGIATLFLLMWRHVDSDRATDYWGNKYDVFFVARPGDPGTARLGWLAEKAADLAAMPGLRREIWGERLLSGSALDAARSADRLLWAALALVGTGVLVLGRRPREALLLLLPLAIMIVFNLAGRWPFGSFRTNLFALTYVAALGACAFDAPVRARGRLATVLPVVLLVLLPLALFEETWQERKRVFARGVDISGAMRELIRMQGPPPARPELLALDQHGCSPWDFYTKFDRETVATLVPVLPLRFDVQCLRQNDVPSVLADVAERLRSRPGERGWLLFSKPALKRSVEADWNPALEVLERRVFRERHLIYAVRLRP